MSLLATSTTAAWLRRAGVVAAAALLAGGLSAAPAQAAKAPSPIDVRVITMNDFHGNLLPPAGSSGRVKLADGSTVNAGGAAYIATHVKQLEAGHPNHLLLSSGDNIGASPLISALFHDEPTIDFLNMLKLDASAIGNHEFDEGYRELLRMQFGGCNPTDGCQFRPSYPGARFPFLAANVTFAKGNLPAALPFTVKFEKGIPIGIIGVTLHDLPTVVTPTAVAGLEFGDEVKSINASADLLDKLGVKTQIVIMHQGDESTGLGGPDACGIEPGIATQIAEKASSKVDVFFSAHTHQQYNCVVTDPAGHPRPLIQGLSFGRLLSVVDLEIDPRTRDVIRNQTVAHNEVVTQTVTPDPAVQALVNEANAKSAPIANRKVGSITADITRAASPAGEQPLGDVIADAQLAGTQGNNAVIAITNEGGIRTDLNYASSPAGEGDGVVTYGEAFAVQPFSNIMQTVTLTGAELKAVLEQQWQPQPDGTTIVRHLQISASLHYSWSQSAPIGSKISAITVNGTPVDPSGSYRISVNNFLAAGGDGFTVFTQGTDLAGGPIDLDAFTAYLTAHPNLDPPPADRITLLP